MTTDLSEITNDQILAEMFRYMTADERAVMCSVAGDPSTVAGKFWGGIPWARGTPCPLLKVRNNYVAISSFRRGDNDTVWRRRKDQFASTHAIMVDDVGTKLELSALPMNKVLPSLVVRTSPGNYQMTYFLDTPMLDQLEAESVIKQIIAKLTGGGADPGMSGVTRVLRLPIGINGKPKYEKDGEPFRTQLVLWRPDIRTSWGELCRAYEVVHKEIVFVEPGDEVTLERKRGFALVKEGLDQLRLVKKATRGWLDIQCPWLLEHTDRADTGSAVAFPMQANGWYGGYKCHHGHCAARGWGDLEDWVGRQIYNNGRATRGPFLGVEGDST